MFTANIHSSPFIAVTVDEATDKANKEQLTIVVRWINEDFVVSKEFLELYCLSAIDAQSIVEAMKDAFLRFQIPLAKLRGQCYDVCSTMAGVKAGVAAKIEQVKPRAVFKHCHGHALNLAVSDTVKQCLAMKDCLDTCLELVKLIKFSPNREAVLREVKEEIGSDAPAVQTLCPTRWTVRAESLASILANYDKIQVLWVTSLHKTSDTEIKARIQGVASQMQLFRFFFCLILSEMILRHTDRLIQTLQQPKLSSVEGHELAMLTVKTLESLRNDENFDMFWLTVEKKRILQNTDEPRLARRRYVSKC
ncbi:zinc finger MYM-type protein 1-like [Corticium candelabrum]|uniref:zinc finger MYM-type protein 1-like n=1 Tax=Corticium candelabrum TaxID=121492 RepID=UPI002E26ADFC|nr:zinc finger MYM-type protein 1-like [Corticium candelabrum]